MRKVAKRGKSKASQAKVKISDLKPAAAVKGGRITNVRVDATPIAGGSAGGGTSKP